jgi:deoxyadenosine/deoxycytidine kinase/NTP pyrophosphatase (non-canonical NTP hydrolase)
MTELSELTRLQRAFDQTRGFAELPNHAGAPSGDALSRLEFALIGLTGEVGEIANILKRARRDQAQGGGAARLGGLPSEIADVLSYLLKLAIHADVDPEQAYLIKMCINAHRFRDPRSGTPRAVSLCGPPGSGKSTLAKLLVNKIGTIPVYIEEYRNNPFLGDLQNPAFDVDASQTWFLDHISDFLNNLKDGFVVLDQDPTAIPLIYSTLLAEQCSLLPKTLRGHTVRLLQLEIEHAWNLAGRVVVLLDASPKTLAERSVDKFGSPPNESFLSDLRKRFASLFRDIPGVISVDTERPLKEVFDEVSGIVEKAVANEC